MLKREALGELVNRFHLDVERIVGRLREILDLASTQGPGAGLYHLDLALAEQLFGNDDKALDRWDPENAARWREIVAPFVPDLKEAKDLWPHLRHDFARLDKAVRFGPIGKSSYHGLALTLANVVALGFDAEVFEGDGGGKWRSLEDLERRESTRRRHERKNLFWQPHSGLPGNHKRKLVEALITGSLWRDFDANLDAECAKVLEKLEGGQPTEREADNAGSAREEESPAAINGLAEMGEDIAAIRETIEKQGQGKVSPELDAVSQAVIRISKGWSMATVIEASPMGKTWLYGQPAIQKALKSKKAGRKSLPRGRDAGI